MRNANKIVAAVAAILVVAVVAFPALAANPATMGGFVKEMAKARNLNATDARIALDSLRAVGVALPADLDLNQALTQRDVAEMARRVGLKVTTSKPDAVFTEEQMDRFFGAFRGELAITSEENPGGGSGPGDNPPFDPFTKARGKGKGKAKFNRTPTEPE